MLGQSIKYTSKWFRLPHEGAPRERFVCRYPTTAERDAFEEANEACRDKDGKFHMRQYLKVCASAVVPLVEGYEIEGVPAVPTNWREVLPEAAEYRNVLVAIGGEIFPGASIESASGADEGS